MQTTWEKKSTSYCKPWIERIVCWQLLHNDIILDIGHLVACSTECFIENRY